jgi:hypothetical protein
MKDISHLVAWPLEPPAKAELIETLERWKHLSPEFRDLDADALDDVVGVTLPRLEFWRLGATPLVRDVADPDTFTIGARGRYPSEDEIVAAARRFLEPGLGTLGVGRLPWLDNVGLWRVSIDSDETDDE